MAPSLHANGSGAQNASCSDFHITSATLSASTTGGNTQGTVDHFLSASGMLASLPNIKKSLITGSILGLCTLEIPFWFSKDPGLSIPLIALQHSEVNLDINYLVCKDICIPGNAKLSLNIPPGKANTTKHFFDIEKSLSQIPNKIFNISDIEEVITKAYLNNNNVSS